MERTFEASFLIMCLGQKSIKSLNKLYLLSTRRSRRERKQFSDLAGETLFITVIKTNQFML